MNHDVWRQKEVNMSRYNPTEGHTRQIPIQYASPPSDIYNVIDDNRIHPNYEEPDESEYYEKLPEFVTRTQPSSSTTKSSLASPSLPPFANHSTLQRLYYPVGKGSNFPQCSRRLKLTACLICISAILIALISAFLWHINVRSSHKIEMAEESEVRLYDPHFQKLHSNPNIFAPNRSSTPQNPNDSLITVNNLATLIVTKRKICIFEVSTNEAENSLKDFEEEHIQGARLIFFGNLSHSGVPVHPLQFQRYVRQLAVDSDCRIILYDKGQQIWASYAFWIFKLFGHEKISLLNGGFLEWKTKAKDQSNLYKIAEGPEDRIEKLGNFRAKWADTFILTFDDMIANFDSHKYEIIDSQSVEEYEGKADGAVFGHIRNSVNIPIDQIYDWTNNTWPPISEHMILLKEKGLSITKPIAIYDGTSLRSSLIWFALHRMNIESGIYFGSWPEFVIRAPDSFKVIPNGLLE